MSDTYRTIERPSEGIYKEKGSRFLAFAHPVACETDAKTLIESYRKKYHDARHVCFAYRTGTETRTERFGDDGEPSGTAGKPIFGQLLSNDVTNALIVVVRYFGGIKLGTGGLISAYREAAADALANNAIVEKDVMYVFDIEFSYENMDAVMRFVKTAGIATENPAFGNICQMRCLVPKSKKDLFLAKMTDLVKFADDF